MPNIDLTGVTESSGGGGGFHLAPGGYVLRVIDFEMQYRLQYVRMKFDVDEGPCAGTFANAQWPISDIMSWKEKALPYLKGKLRAFSESNEGFDANDAFQRDAFQEFMGMRVGAIVRDRLYTGRDGNDKTGNDIYQLVPVATIASGDFVVPGPKDDRKGGEAKQAAPNPPTPAPAYAQPQPQYYPQPQPQPQYYPQQQAEQMPQPQYYPQPQPQQAEQLPWE